MKGVRGRIDVLGQEVLPLREEDVREAAAELLRRRRRGDLVSLLFSYRNAEHEIRVGEILAEEHGRSGGSNGEVPVYLSRELYPHAPRPAAAQLDPDRGLRRRAHARHAAERCATQTSERGRRLRAAGDGRARRHDLDRGQGAGADAASPGRSAAWSAARRWPSASGSRTCSAPTSAAPRFDIALITDGRFEITPTPDIARFVLNMPAGQDRLDRRRHRLVRARQPELEPARARPGLGGLADRRLLAGGRPRDGLGHRPERGARAGQPRLLPGRRHEARPRARPRTRSSARSPSRSGSRSRRRRPG